ncbi:exosortase A [Novosphingobium sp. 1949]|uniref:Exosortase A n=1 Tax=Novosphingobium organovorum TaxID=2930092 RepID=A0ABT0B9Y3_9SPHN|nr:exosortase A [Novosphingobium organovorum]MCJ2181668.1 exosortase A [Novosphingobium organovorum]
MADTGSAGSAPIMRGLAIVPGWRVPLVRLGALWLLLFVVFASDWMAMVRQWWDISTYNHMILIPIVEVWLVWQRRRELAQLEPAASALGLVLFAGAALLWLLGGVSGFDLVRQAGAVALLAASVPLLLGLRVSAALLFPLCYLVFIVPFGEEMVKSLQTITAHITIALTHASGIPAVIDGVFIDTPAGLFEVAEACSGVKFLIAMIAFGVLAANVCFVSWRRRGVLLLACLVVPILANGVRAWGTIYAAQIVGTRVAAGFDHIVYGWFFFAIVLALVILGAWRFFDRPSEAPMIDIAALRANRVLARAERRMRLSPVLALALCLAALAGVKLWAYRGDHLAAPLPARIVLPDVPGWTRVPYAPSVWWEPLAQGSEHRLLGRYADASGATVDVFVALYSGQGEGREAGGFGQGALTPETSWSWQSSAPGIEQGRGERLLAEGRVERLAQTWYRNGGLLSGSNLELKLAVIADQMALRAEPTTLLILSAEEGERHDAAARIARFRAASGPLASWIDRIAAGR